MGFGDQSVQNEKTQEIQKTEKKRMSYQDSLRALGRKHMNTFHVHFMTVKLFFMTKVKTYHKSVDATMNILNAV